MNKKNNPDDYPKKPKTVGALPRKTLEDIAEQQFAVWNGANKFDLLCAALTANSKASVELLLSLGAPMTFDEASVFNIVSIYFNDYRATDIKTDPQSNIRLGGTQQEGLSWLQYLMNHPSCTNEDIEKAGRRLVLDAVSHGNTDILDFLNGHPLLKNKIIDHMADMFVNASSHKHAQKSLEWTLRHFPDGIEVKNNSDETPLLMAATSGSFDRIKLLLQHGANIRARNDNGSNILHLFYTESPHAKEQQGGSKSINTFIDTVYDCAGPEQFQEMLKEFDDQGYLPIHEIANTSDPDDWTKIAPSGDIHVLTDFNDGNPNVTPLGMAFSMFDYKNAKSLIAQGADIRRLNTDGDTGWHILAQNNACYNNKKDRRNALLLAWLLMKQHISPETPNANGVRPAEVSNTPLFDRYLSKTRRKALFKKTKEITNTRTETSKRKPSF